MSSCTDATAISDSVGGVYRGTVVCWFLPCTCVCCKLVRDVNPCRLYFVYAMEKTLRRLLRFFFASGQQHTIVDRPPTRVGSLV